MKLFIGGDHAGFEMKSALAEYLKSAGYDVTDFGPYKFDANDDYPDFVKLVARAVAADPLSKGIIIGGSGQGEAMCANRFPGVRAAVFYGESKMLDIKLQEMSDILKLSREHNDANILSLGARFLSFDEACDAVLKWLNTAFSGEERHVRRLRKIDSSK